MARDLAGYARLRLSTFPQPRSSTARQALTSEFTRIIHRPVHRALSWLVKGCR